MSNQMRLTVPVTWTLASKNLATETHSHICDGKYSHVMLDKHLALFVIIPELGIATATAPEARWDKLVSLE